MFYITAIVYALGAVAYILMGSGEIQPWAAKKVHEPKNIEQLIPFEEKA